MRTMERIPQANFSRSPDSTSKNFPDFGIRTPLHGTTGKCSPAPLLLRLHVTICTKLYLVLV